jgi:hypothetical protein
MFTVCSTPLRSAEKIADSALHLSSSRPEAVAFGEHRSRPEIPRVAAAACMQSAGCAALCSSACGNDSMGMHSSQFAILQCDRLPACQVQRLEAGATKTAAREAALFLRRPEPVRRYTPQGRLREGTSSRGRAGRSPERSRRVQGSRKRPSRFFLDWARQRERRLPPVRCRADCNAGFICFPSSRKPKSPPVPDG